MADHNDTLDKLHDQLADGIETLRDSKRWRDWLDTAAAFHHYSFNNTLLIHLQHPGATKVAGYRTWQRLGRQVQKGETAIRILAPVKATKTKRDEHGQVVTDVDGDPIKVRRLVGFTDACVFDISQTEGEPLAEPATELSGDGPDGAWFKLATVAVREGFTVHREPISGAANGLCDHQAGRIVVDDQLADAQAVKTLVHELAHAMLHGPGQVDYRNNRPRCECEAESVAYIVCGALGLDASAYSFGYVATWTTDDRELIEQTGHQVVTTARRILNATTD